MRDDDKILRISKKTLHAIYDCYDLETEKEKLLYEDEAKEYGEASNHKVDNDEQISEYLYYVLSKEIDRNKKEVRRLKDINEKHAEEIEKRNERIVAENQKKLQKKSWFGRK